MKNKFIINWLCIFVIVATFPTCAQNWSSVGGGTDNDVRCFFADTVSNILYVGGNFTQSGPVTTNGIGALSNQSWDSLGLGVNGCINTCLPVLSICKFNGNLYVAGGFSGIGNIPDTKGIARWNGTIWESIGDVNGVIFSLALFNNNLYASGNFDSVSNIQAHNIARFDGNSWNAVADTIFRNQPIACSAVYQGELYVGGTMHNFNLNIHCIAKYDGNTWGAPSPPAFTNAMFSINTMVPYQNKLYVAGYFTSTAGAPGDGIACWDGNTWSGVGGGLTYTLSGSPANVDALCIHQNKLVAGGAIGYAGGVPTCNIALWDGNLWCSLGGYSNSSISAAASFNDTLYIGGGFTIVDADTSIHFVAKWIGGSYVDTCGVISTAINEQIQQSFSVQVIPNPVNQNGIFQMIGLDGDKTLIIYDQFGREIWRKETDENQIEFSVEGFAAGMYYYHVEQNGEIITCGKLVVQ